MKPSLSISSRLAWVQGSTTSPDKLTDLLVRGIPKQDVLLLLMDGVYIDFLSRKITIPGEGCTLQQFAQNFADEVLDHAHALQDPPGWREADEYDYAERIEKLDFFSQVPYDDSRVELSSLFNKIVIENILQGAASRMRTKTLITDTKWHSLLWAPMPTVWAAASRAVPRSSHA
jgi:hypothetical protein